MRAIEKRLRERIKDLETELESLKKDRELFREHFILRFKWWLTLLGQGKEPNMGWLVQEDSKWLAKFSRWWW